MVSTIIVTAALLSTALISLAPNIVLFLFPDVTAESQLLQLGQAMAAGGLLGDVFLHTLSEHDVSSENGPSVGLWVLAGFSIFFAADLILRSCDPHHHHNHHHSHCESNSPREETQEHSQASKPLLNGNGKHHDMEPSQDSIKKTTPIVNKSTILLNLAADSLHNFTDGLAIGASFSIAAQTSNHGETPSLLSLLLASRGGLATLSILFHEVPHELGDFCTLIRAGYTNRQAVLAQFFTAMAAFAGAIAAVYVSSSDGVESSSNSNVSSERLLFITAGGFIYLAATTILPDILESSGSWKFRVAQFFAFCIGIGFLYLVAVLEDYDQSHDHGHGSHHGHHHHGHGHKHHDEHHRHDHHHHNEKVHTHGSDPPGFHHHDHGHGEL